MADAKGRDSVEAFAIANLGEARFECTFGRGCDGVCCRQGRPPVSHQESLTIAHALPRIRGSLRREAEASIERHGFLSKARGRDHSLRVAGGWCVFFNEGCALHRLGLEEGQADRYKPAACALFPLAQNQQGVWFVRQRHAPNERWNLFCLDPDASPVPAAISLRNEIALARRLDREGRYAERLPTLAEPADERPVTGVAGNQ